MPPLRSSPASPQLPRQASRWGFSLCPSRPGADLAPQEGRHGGPDPCGDGVGAVRGGGTGRRSIRALPLRGCPHLGGTSASAKRMSLAAPRRGGATRVLGEESGRSAGASVRPCPQALPCALGPSPSRSTGPLLINTRSDVSCSSSCAARTEGLFFVFYRPRCHPPTAVSYFTCSNRTLSTVQVGSGSVDRPEGLMPSSPRLWIPG